jgi:hypothetical protein
VPSIILNRAASDPAIQGVRAGISPEHSTPQVQYLSNMPRPTYVPENMIGTAPLQPPMSLNSMSVPDESHYLPEQPGSPTSHQTDVLHSRNSPEAEAGQTDLQGHYVGPSSGVSFLRRALKRLQQVISLTPNSSMFTFGDSPLPSSSDTSFFVLPPKSEAQILVARYFNFALPTHRFLHQPTVESWLHDLYENLGYIPHKPGMRERQAVLFMVFAQAKEYMPARTDTDVVDTRYYNHLSLP